MFLELPGEQLLNLQFLTFALFFEHVSLFHFVDEHLTVILNRF